MPKNPFDIPNLGDTTFGIKEKPNRKKVPKERREQVWSIYRSN